MGLLGNVLTGRPLRAEGWSPWADEWYQPIGGGVASSGVRITPETALANSTVWAAVRLLAGSMASLPLIVYRKLPGGGKERALEHPLYDLFHEVGPNPLQTPFMHKFVLMVHALLWGNGYAEIKPGPRGPVDSLWPLHPDGTRLEHIPGGVRYVVREANGAERRINDEDVFHLPGLSIDGYSGLGLIQYARESIGMGLAAQQYQARLFSQNARPGGILQTTGKLSKEAADRLAASWQAAHSGVANSHRVAVLEEGVQWSATGMTSEDAQVLATVEWSVEDVARFFNVPLHLIQHQTKSTSWGSGIESLSQGFVDYSLMPWAVSWQDTIRKDLILARKVYTAEFLFDALLRGDPLKRAQKLNIERNAGVLNADEWRAVEGRNPLPNGEGQTYLTPMNMEPAGQEPAGPSAPAPSGDGEAADEETDEEADARAFGEGGVLAFSANGHAGMGGDE